MTTRRSLLLGLCGLTFASGGYAVGAFQEAQKQSESRLFQQGTRIDTSAGQLEYAIAGDGPPLMMIHGTGGGFDQGLRFAARLRQNGFRIVAPLRFGYLGSAFPDDASPVHQADVLVAVPTIILSCEDDLLGTAATARLLAKRIAGAEMTIYATGRHIWLCHDAEVAERIPGFVRHTVVRSDAEEDQ